MEFAVLNGRPVAHGKAVNRIVFAYRVVRIKVKGDGEASFRYKSGGKYAGVGRRAFERGRKGESIQGC